MNYPQDVWAAISEVEAVYSLPHGFYTDLPEEDDWSFIVKLHTLFEAAINDLVVEALAEERLRNVISYLELNGKRTGKMAIVKAMELLDNSYCVWIAKLSEVRNEFAHNIGNVPKSLNMYSNNPDKLKALCKDFCFGTEKIEFDDRKLENIEYVREDFKKVIWVTGALCLAIIRIKTLQTIEKRDLRKRKSELTAALTILERFAHNNTP